MHRFGIIFFLICICTLQVKSQIVGCTDEKAINYDANAEINDGSCLYSRTFHKPKKVIKRLPYEVSESSGLIYWRNAYWTHNDSGGENVLYRLDSITGKIVQKITVEGATNIDWEEIDQDEQFIYIGDFGNNAGNRKNLLIYKIDKATIPDSIDASVSSEIIHYRYGDQENFDIRYGQHDFDCEAMIVFNDSLYLFTKNWANLSSRLYALPKIPGDYTIYPLDEYGVDGLVTGASIDYDNGIIVLCGYKNYNPFVLIINNFTRNDFFSGNKRRIDLKDLKGTQTEGIAYSGNYDFVISSEKTVVAPPRLFRFNVKEFL